MKNIGKYEIYRADAKEWARYHAIYRLSKFNEWMSLSFESDINRYANADFCYWVMMDDKKVGGAFIKPNILKCIFTIPPFNNMKELIEALTLYTLSLSDKSNPITVPDADLEQAEHYNNAGFNLERIEKIMVCPTNKFEISPEERYEFVTPRTEHAEEMAKLFYDTYRNHKLLYNSSQPYEFQVSAVQAFFDHIKAMKLPNEWSALVFDKVTNKFIGACVVGLVNELPYILNFVVHPDFQRKGIAAKMMQRTLNFFHEIYPAVRLNVIEGNNAEIFYDKFGFISLARNGYMTRSVF